MASSHSIQCGYDPQRPHHPHALLRTVLDEIDDRDIVASLRAYRWTGRPGYSPAAMWRAYVASFVLNLPHTNALIRRLEDDADLRAICGFEGVLPHRTTFNRFIQRLNQHAELIEQCMADLNGMLRSFLPDLGSVVAVDSTMVRTHSRPTHWPSGKPKKPNASPASDPDADWGAKNSTGSPINRKKERGFRFSYDGKDWYFGHKVHMISDAKYEIPLAQFVTPVNVSDMNTIVPLVERAEALQDWLSMSILLADKGYDSGPNNDYLHQKGIAPVIAIRDLPKNRKGEPNLRDGIYTEDGIPTCMGNVPMEYVKSDPDLGHLYRCRSEGCRFRDSTTGGVLHCDGWVWEDPNVNVRWFGGAVRRGSEEWKRLYKKRQSIERIFKSMKESRRLESHCVRGLAQIALHSLMSSLAYQATILAQLRAGEERWRWMVRKVA